VPTMQGFVKSYFSQRQDVDHSRKIMYYFTPDKLPVLTTLATEFAIFNSWFSSIPGPQICNRMFAHYGTSFGQVGNELLYDIDPIQSVYERMIRANRSAKFYYYDQQSPAMGVVQLIKDQPGIFAAFEEFLSDCKSGALPDYSYIEPNHHDHSGPSGGMEMATDQHPDHNVQAGEWFIACVYNAILNNPSLWETTALLITYDQHCGLYDHVPPPTCSPDGFVARSEQTGTGEQFAFNRLGVRVPAILVSPWVRRGTVVSGRVFEHASIPATVTSHFLGNFDRRTPREKEASTFLDLFSDQMRPDSEIPHFNVGDSPLKEPPTPPRSPRETPAARPEPVLARSSGRHRETKPRVAPKKAVAVPSAQAGQTLPPTPTIQPGPSTHVARDRWTTDDSLGHYPYAYAIYRFLTDPETKPPLAISIQAPWGGGKTSLMRMIQTQLDPDAIKQADVTGATNTDETKNATVKHVLRELETATANSPAPNATGPAPTSAPASPNVLAESNPSQGTQPTIPPIQKPGERRVTIWFNAWKYESTAQVWAGLADCIVQQIGERLDLVERELFWFRLQLRRLDAGKIRRKIHEEIFSAFVGKLLSWSPAYLAGLAALVVAAVNHAWISAGGLLSTALVSSWFQFWKAKSETEKKPAHISLGEFVQAPDYAANLGFVHEVVEDLKRVFSLIPKKHLPMVVFIDDLDRCSPGKVAAVVEAINLFLAGEFPDCMFILGIDDEMVAAALDQAHSDVIAKLPGYARSTSIGWRFMDKFVQLPFVMPPADKEDLTRYVESLLSQDGPNTGVNMQTRDIAARVVEQSTPSSTNPDQVVSQVSALQPLAPDQQETLKKEVKIIQDMNENIKKFTDQEKNVRDAISQHAKQYFNNPRDTKRFVNLFRFYYFLRAARQARGQQVPSTEQLCRWLAFSLKWPEVVRWLRRHPVPQDGSSESCLAVLERLGGTAKNLAAWQDRMDKTLGLKAEETPWLADEELHAFLRVEASEYKVKERLSSCSEKGLW
jgi:phospholipase C